MKRDIEQLMKYLGTLSRDQRVKPKHITIFLTLVYIGLTQGTGEEIKITRRLVMEKAHIKGIPTYHKYIRELQQFGYIDYFPTYHPKEGSKVMIRI